MDPEEVESNIKSALKSPESPLRLRRIRFDDDVKSGAGSATVGAGPRRRTELSMHQHGGQHGGHHSGHHGGHPGGHHSGRRTFQRGVHRLQQPSAFFDISHGHRSAPRPKQTQSLLGSMKQRQSLLADMTLKQNSSQQRSSPLGTQPTRSRQAAAMRLQQPAAVPGIQPRQPLQPTQQWGWSHRPDKTHTAPVRLKREAFLPHQFYRDSSRNSEQPPSWFFEACTREEAESILTMGKTYGNVLLRESVTFRNTGSYVISMRREVAGGTQLNHYEVRRTGSGFKINVDNAHHPMRSLEEVMNFFVVQAGSSSRPMGTNDLYKLGLPTLAIKMGQTKTDNGFVGFNDSNNNAARSQSPPPSSRLGGGFRPTHGQAPSPPSWNTPPSPPPPMPVSSSSSNSYPDVEPPPPPVATSDGRRQRLQASGNVPSFMQEVAREVEYDIRKTGPSSTGGFSNPSLNATVPANAVPSETIQRNGGLDRLDGRMGNLYLNEDEFQNGGSPPPAAPPLPSGHPTMGAPRPPPSPPPFNTTRPNMGRQNSWGQGSAVSGGSGGYDGQSTLGHPNYGAQNQAGQHYGAQNNNAQPQGYNTQPTASNRAPPRGGALNFEDELKGKLVGRREQIYADGATVLKSNWN